MSIPADPSWQPKAVVFDLLTAILDSWSLWDNATPTQSAADGRRWRTRYLELSYGQGAYVPYEELVQRSAADTALPLSAATSLLHNWSSLLPWPEVPALLVALRRRGIKVGVVTNCSRQLGEQAVRNLEGFVRASTGSADFEVDGMITAEESGFYKPVRAAYEAVLPRLGAGVAKEDVLFVAGSPGDVQGATDAGIRVVWHNHIGLPKKGDAVPLREGRTLDETLKGFLEDE